MSTGKWGNAREKEGNIKRTINMRRIENNKIKFYLLNFSHGMLQCSLCEWDGERESEISSNEQ